MFTDIDLAQAMLALLVSSGLMTSEQQIKLRSGATENNVREALGADITKSKFASYWAKLADWLRDNGGDLASITATQVPGRINPVNTSLSDKSLYEDAFSGVNRYIDSDTFLVIKAISNHMRFVNFYLEEEDDDSDS